MTYSNLYDTMAMSSAKVDLDMSRDVVNMRGICKLPSGVTTVHHKYNIITLYITKPGMDMNIENVCLNHHQL